MSFIRKYWEYVTLIYRYVCFKFRQNRLKTNETFVVVTTYGPIKGIKRRSTWNVPFYSFEKIPFAKPPIGELRFKAPVPPDPWEEVKDCTAEGPIPLQTNLISKRIEGSEDCLYLNVYTKNLNPEKLMPVMIWIYGGGFETGGATKDLYSPDYFMEKDVVLITINYRVGPFGFLVFNDPDLNIPGNAGIKDQVLALKWIKANCMNFGGDPDNITVFGESAGAASTHYMMLTDQTKGLFHKAILMSGSVLCPWALIPNIQSGYRLAKALHYNGSNTDDNVCFEYIKNAKGKDILHAERYVLNNSDKNKRILFPFGPVIEPYITNDCIIPEHPRIMIRKAWSINIPMIIGGTANEGLIVFSGFLSFKDPDLRIPGNAGLKDQVLALKWIKKNCINFGGNEFNITLFGQEAGAASAHYMMLCDRTRGLFHKAILMSGNVFCQWAINKQRNIAYRLAKRMGYEGDNNDQNIYEFIKNLDGKKLIKAEKRILSAGEIRKRIFSPFGPVIEPYSTVQCVLRRSPMVKLRRAWGNQIPLLIGGTSFEGLLYFQGFISFNDPDLNIPGNAGLKDQVLALKWIKANCMNFGGDSNNITVFGESAGAASTHYMTLTNRTKGLFHKAILMSGSVLCPWAFYTDNPQQNAFRLAKLLGYNGSLLDDNECLNFLQEINGKYILNALPKILTHDEKMKRVLFPFGPIIEPYYTDDCVIPENPRLMMQKSWGNQIPMIIGGTSDEGLLFYPGFLSFDDSSLNVPGNAGLKDQVLALKWSKANCMGFGGDPNNITVFGESAGAASTHYMMLTDQTKGLFHKAILMSGSVLCPWAITVHRNWAYRLAKLLGYKNVNDDEKVFQFLCSVEGERIAKEIRSVQTEEERKSRISYAFGPVVEPYITEDCVVPFDPRLMMHLCWGNRIPMMIGCTSFEGLFCYGEIKRNKNILENINDCEYLVPMELNLDRSGQSCRKLGLQLRLLHFGDKIPGKSTIFEYLDLLSYKFILHGLHRTIRSRLKFSSSATYLYRFDFDSPYFNHVRNLCCGHEIRSGVSHADDLSYIFLNAMSDNLDKSSFEYKTIQNMIGIWTEFALKGNPNHNCIKSVDWKPLQHNVIPYKCLNISREIEIIDLPEMRKLLEWDKLYCNGGLI